MGILTSLYTGASGLTAHGDAISVVGDNISNASTIGYKSSRASFDDLLGGVDPNGQNVGVGVRMNGPETLFGQGSLQTTGNALDLAIRGNGFFEVAGNHNGLPGTYYTRDGRFALDKSGSVVNPEGLKLQGYLVDASGKLSSSVTDLNLAGQASPPKVTTKADLAINLDSSAQVMTWDPLNPGTTSNFQTSTTVYDSVGNSHRVDLYFVNGGGGAWTWHGMVDGADVGGTKGTPTEIATGSLGFTTDGKLDTETPGTSSASFVGATAGQAIAFDFGDAITTDGGTGLAGSTQFAGASSVAHLSQDGYAAGQLLDVNVKDDGTITGTFSNGQSRDVARVALATFSGEEGLQRAGNQLFAETPASGQPLVNGAGSGGTGSIASGALEASNVDIGAELVTLIAYQRAFQANARTITTADEMLQEIANLKR